MVFSRYFPWLYEGVTMEIKGYTVFIVDDSIEFDLPKLSTMS
jgi:hypothetical protein